MNFLAHSLMGFDDDALIAGQFCGDYVRGRDLSHFPRAVERGIRMHRFLDIYTDSYPELQSARADIQQLPRRFSGIVVDVLFDHYLARNWTVVSKITLSEHAENIHEALANFEQVLPDSLNRFRRLLKEREILENNVYLSSIEFTLSQLASRSPRFSVLGLGQVELATIRETLEPKFETFYPSLKKAALKYIEDHPLSGNDYSHE